MAPGDFIGGRYRLIKHIAKGGMADVWLADDTYLGRKIAVKVLRDHVAADPTMRERFRREAIAMASIIHPNVVAVYDCIDHDGKEAVIMEHVEGKSLRQILDSRKKLTPQLTIHIGQSAAAALHAIHSRDLVHRDVKPGNILVTPQGMVKLADFGIAKSMVDGGDDLTAGNIMMGAAKYLSPEQFAMLQEGTDGRADLYSLGIVLYECLAGRVPFLEQSDADTALARLRREPTPLGSLRPTVSPQLTKVIHTLLKRNRDHRYPDAWSVFCALEEAKTRPHAASRGSSQVGHPQPPSKDADGSVAVGPPTDDVRSELTALIAPATRRRRGLVAAVALAVLAAALGLGWYW